MERDSRTDAVPGFARGGIVPSGVFVLGQSVENSDAHARYLELRRYVSAIVAKERAWLEARLGELKPGETWCHHEAQTDAGSFDTWVRTISGHVLPPGMHCAVSGARVQYGPAPEPWPPAPAAVHDDTPRGEGL